MARSQGEPLPNKITLVGSGPGETNKMSIPSQRPFLLRLNASNPLLQAASNASGLSSQTKTLARLWIKASARAVPDLPNPKITKDLLK